MPPLSTTMLEVSHTLIGASLASLIPNPYLGIPLALVSHFLADLFPHWDFNTRKVKRSKATIIAISLTDSFLGLTLGYLLFSHLNLNYLFAMMLISQAPDWLEAPLHIFNWRFPPFTTIKAIQSKLHHKLDLPWGLIYQTLVVIIVVIIAKVT